MPIEGLALPQQKINCLTTPKPKIPTRVKQNAQYSKARGEEMGHSP
jgi:hypothetical protein